MEKKAVIEYNHNMLAAHVIFPLLEPDMFKFEKGITFTGKVFFLPFVMENERWI